MKILVSLLTIAITALPFSFAFAEDEGTSMSAPSPVTEAADKSADKTADKAPDKAAGDTGTYFMCKNGTSVRTIRIKTVKSVCYTYYTKEGVDSVAGHSKKPEVCDGVAGRIKTNLEAGNWKCKDISQARVSSSLE